jgi:hypothetical protein
MNSLYGKFAEKRRITTYVPLEEGGAFDKIVYDMAQVTEEYAPFHQNTIIAAYVTSYARVHLFNLMHSIVERGGEIIYCDTDSVIYRGSFDLVTSDSLGGVKIEQKIKLAEILGAKYYRTVQTDGTISYVCKGVPKEKQEAMFKGKRIAYFNRPIRWREAIRRNLQPNVWLPTSKEAKHIYDKRKVMADGTTRPIVLTL